nr:hypothetical protein [Brevundimonas vesicularis]
MVGGQAKDIVLGLAAGVTHQNVPAPLRRGGRDGFIGVEEHRLTVWPVGGARLFSLQNEAAALVEVDAQGGGQAFGLASLHAAFEDVVVGAGVVAGGVWPGQIQRFAQLGEEHLVVGALGAAASGLPALYEVLGIHVMPPAT